MIKDSVTWHVCIVRLISRQLLSQQVLLMTCCGIRWVLSTKPICVFCLGQTCMPCKIAPINPLLNDIHSISCVQKCESLSAIQHRQDVDFFDPMLRGIFFYAIDFVTVISHHIQLLNRERWNGTLFVWIYSTKWDTVPYESMIDPITDSLNCNL